MIVQWIDNVVLFYKPGYYVTGPYGEVLSGRFLRFEDAEQHMIKMLIGAAYYEEV